MSRCANPERRVRAGSVWIAAAIVLALTACLIGFRESVGATGTPVAGPTPAGDDLPTGLVPARPDAPVVYGVGAGGLYLSDDGNRWEEVGPPPPAGAVVVAVDEPNLLLAGDRPVCARGTEGTSGSPLQRSTDGGASWDSPAAEMQLLPLAVWAEPPLALAADCVNLVISTDAGEEWRPVFGTNAQEPGRESGFRPTVLLPLPAVPSAERSALLVGTSDGGASRLWRVDLSDPNAPGIGEPLLEFYGNGALDANEDLYVLGTPRGVYVSSDHGATWELQRAGLETVTVSVDPFRAPMPAEEQGRRIDAVAIDPSDSSHLFAGTAGGLFESQDTGTSWQPVAGVDEGVIAIVLRPEARRLLVQTVTGIVAVSLDPVNPSITGRARVGP